MRILITKLEQKINLFFLQKILLLRSKEYLICVILSFLFLTTSCTIMSKYKIDELLENKYKEKFIILKEESGWFDDKVKFQAAPAAASSIVFTGTYNKKTKHLNEYYRTTYYGEKATIWLQQKLAEQYEHFAASADIRCTQKGGKLPPLETFLKQEADDIDFIGRMYLFTELTDANKKEILGGIHEIYKYLHDIQLDNVVFDLSFFDAKLLNQVALEKTDFGFNIIRKADFENNADFMQRRYARIMFKIPKKVNTPSIEDIYSIKLENPEKPRFHIFK